MLHRQARIRRDPAALVAEATPAPPPQRAARSALRLEWPGRVWEPRSGAPAGGEGAVVDEQGDAGARLVHGDVLDVTRALQREGHGGRVDLVYVDPPFASQTAYVHEARLDGPADGRVLRTRAYDDRWAGDGVGGYLDMLAPRLEALAGLLAPAGTIWVHVDWRASYLVRSLLDEILGRSAFVNEIVWRRAPNLGRQAASNQFGRTLDTIVVYGREHARLTPPTRLDRIDPKHVRRDAEGRPFVAAPRGDYTDESVARLEAEGRIHRTGSGKVYIKYFLVPDSEGALCRERRVDALWTDVAPLRHAAPSERTGFPTQKPRALLDRIVACASPPGGLVVDAFSGSGTTGESAHALGRRFVLGDESPLAIATARARLLRAGVDVSVERCGPARCGGDSAAEGPRVRVERGQDVRVELVEPRDPLAWAIDLAHGAGQPLQRAWHSQRAPGMRARPAAREARFERAPGPVAVRVWYDDGRVATWTEGAP